MLFVHGVGHCHPENEISNRFLEDLDIGTTDAWIMERTGIHSRRTVLDLDYISETRNEDVRAAGSAVTCTNSELGRRAALQALERAEITPADIGMVIAGGTAPDMDCPAEACGIAAALDLDVPAVDVRSACTSFGAAVHLLSLMQPLKVPDFVLVVNPETVTRTVNYNDRQTAVLWGDAAAAVVISARLPSRAAIVQSDLVSQPSGHDKVVIPWASYFQQEGRTVQTFAIKRTVRMLKAIQKELGGAIRERLHFIGHQANALMPENVCRMCEIPKERHHSNVRDFGNTGTAGPITVLSSKWSDFQGGDHVAILGVGGGLTWSSTLIQYQS